MIHNSLINIFLNVFKKYSVVQVFFSSFDLAHLKTGSSKDNLNPGEERPPRYLSGDKQSWKGIVKRMLGVGAYDNRWLIKAKSFFSIDSLSIVL